MNKKYFHKHFDNDDLNEKSNLSIHIVAIQEEDKYVVLSFGCKLPLLFNGTFNRCYSDKTSQPIGSWTL